MHTNKKHWLEEKCTSLVHLMKKIKNIANSYKTQISTDYKKLTPRDFNKVLMKIINLATLFYTAVLSSD